jgi:polo-like kinase 1
MFRLSNKVVQVIFHDGTEVVLFSDSKAVSYRNKKGERVILPLASAIESPNQEMTKRLNYTRQVLAQILNAPGK